MRLTNALLGEHGVFYALFDHLDQVAPKVETLEMIQTQASLLASALATHAHLEEDLLFTSLDPHLGKMGPLSVMRMEHSEIENTLEQIQGIADLAEARLRLMHLVEIARQHFAKEEQVLFKLAEQMLGKEVLADLGAQWAERRGVMIGS